MKLTSLSRDEKERGRLLNGIYSKFGRERSRSMEWHAMAASGILFFSPRGIPRNEKRGGDLADAIYAARFLFPGSHTC